MLSPSSNFRAPCAPTFLLVLSFEITVVREENHGGKKDVGAEKQDVPGLNVHIISFIDILRFTVPERYGYTLFA